ncbi:MAG: glycosyltransferase family 10 [Rhodobacteraceae bacterium]|nr:glycosyltransferase family 10 [Paracoccaceae bacterium]
MSAPAPAVAVLPYGNRLGRTRIALDALNWPLGRPDRLQARGTLDDLAPTDHLLVYPTTGLHFRLRRDTRARVSVMVIEPSVVHARHLALLRLTYRRFFRVLSYNEDLLARIPNGVFHPHGTTWVPEWRDLRIEKTRHLSLIASKKRDTEGHKLRHATVDWARSTGIDMDALGGGYAPFADKSEGLAPYRFSVVIENVREPNYFTEKLVDAVLCETVPIYWGCPNLGRFFDTEAIVQCATPSDLHRAIAAATPALYARKLAALRALKPLVATYIDYEAGAARAVLASL